MMTARRCERCGATRGAGDAWPDLCPACLLASALSVSDDACPYHVLAPIDRDRRGITYLAQQLAGSREYVALKVFDRQEDEAAIRARYQTWKPRLDAFADRRFSRFLDLGIAADGRLFVATEYVPGWALPTLRARTSFDAAARRAAARQLLQALADLHAAGLAHLGLTPARIRSVGASSAAPRVLGLGMALVIDGVSADPDRDRQAAVSLLRWLGLGVPEHASLDLASMASALHER